MKHKNGAVLANSHRAAIYTRVSTDEQARFGVSLDAQEARARAYCELHGLTVDAIYRDEGVSGAKPLSVRPLGSALAAAAETGTIGHVVALKLDRLFRDAIDCLETSRRWDAAGVAMHLIDLGGQTVNSASAMGRFMLTVVAGAAEMERNLVRERTRTALQHKKARGDRLGASPLGYRTPGPGAALQPDKAELATVRLILSLRRRDPRRWTFREIATRLERDGHRTKHDCSKWAPGTVKRIWDRRKWYAAVAHMTVSETAAEV